MIYFMLFILLQNWNSLVICQFHVNHRDSVPSWTAGPVQDLYHGKQDRAFCPTWYKQWELMETKCNVAPLTQAVPYPIWTVANSTPSLLLARMATVTAAQLKWISSQVQYCRVFPNIQGIWMGNRCSLPNNNFITISKLWIYILYVLFNTVQCTVIHAEFVALTYCF